MFPPFSTLVDGSPFSTMSVCLPEVDRLTCLVDRAVDLEAARLRTPSCVFVGCLSFSASLSYDGRRLSSICSCWCLLL